MLVDFNAPILTLKGEPLVEGGEKVTVGGLVSTLIAVLNAEPNLAPATRKLRFWLAMRLTPDCGEVELTEAELTVITELLNKSTLPPLYSEQVALALEGKPNPLAKKGTVVQMAKPNGGVHETPTKG